ncbi:lycopene beta-cyclase [Streptomyces sp. SAI-135]|uniref:lycopene cyclase family protein n=1 Tax=unclassified Streptomyces TaxID=2593676 RepID=UPI0024733AA9|nr:MULTISPECIES: lycopene cyclase family protein [unclassified Streptomyces]MDH6521408.1 lycopene beta-cyclase [Streptomyces sp. SAI-090]MDH6553631.1 lycopene beta-cyclase [Streptomyces sp. SAI-041]MDH6572712.1 lycopene beta-cyclase [Streptomyces sp. SAI-117]MDH6582326.1 lycopene beta-cyclase [Streptomyces sp. SAI-133]MDH6614495.1 lycopene beta-cyclase [Streptomyces sp. SAI-135]
MYEADVAIIGAGAAGLSLAHRLSRPAPGTAGLSVVLLDAPPGPLRPPRRTWCFWESGRGPYDAAVTRSWQRLRVHRPTGEPIEQDISPLRYKMIHSDDFESLVQHDLDRGGRVRRVEATVESVEGLPRGARVDARTADGHAESVRARWVFDSRPLGSLPAARTTLLQHFHGWFVRTRRPVFDPARAEFMDLRTRQPAQGLSFGYVLPTRPDQALVEYTEFSPAVLSADAYDEALTHYTGTVLGLGDFEVTGTESGVIPMTDARFARQTGASVFRIGTAGGATRPSTGYTFAGVQRQTAAVAAALHRGRRPLPPQPHSPRARAMDAVLLHALDSGLVDGADFFARLFTRIPMTRLLRFLDGGTRPHEDIAIGLRTPVLPMLRAATEVPRLPLRPFPGP